MFEELDEYKNRGHFFFQKGDLLSVQNIDVPELPGVYYILRLAEGKVDLVYIGKSGTMQQNGQFKSQFLKGRINNKQEGLERQQFFDKKIELENIDGLDIYWFVTYDQDQKDLPAFVKAQLLQSYFDLHSSLPPWNKEF
ncbi:hypothetical protein [Croceimicrobium sp.]|uniref:hypothetical protein n=1 Tax=Croceimicrobium sp. TaxID=2828340 RepID=UPI003BAA2DD0